MPKVSLSNVALHYQSRGEGQPMVLLPGALGSGAVDMLDQLTFFSAHYRVIAVDPRGYGQSRPPQRDYPIDFYERDAGDALELMTALGYDRFIVLGWSDGANSAAILAARCPERITQLAVWGGNPTLTEEEFHRFQAMRSLDTWSPRALEPMQDLYGDDLQELWNSYIDGLKAIHNKGGDIYISELSKIRCPTLILHGEKDPLVAAEHPRTLHETIANSELLLYPDGKHNIHTRYAQEFNAAVLSFLRRTQRT
jgi:valacyclovir hydrolase